MDTFKFGDEVVFDLQSVVGQGKVVGVATTEMPVIGRFLIIEVTDGQFPNDVYPFSHISCPEVNLKPYTNTGKLTNDDRDTKAGDRVRFIKTRPGYPHQECRDLTVNKVYTVLDDGYGDLFVLDDIYEANFAVSPYGGDGIFEFVS